MSLIFISHSSADAAMAAEVRRHLKEVGHQSVFLDFDPADGIPAGRNWEQELYRNIRACRAVVVLCSQRSMASRWCFMEITYARALGKELFPIKIEDCDLDGVITDRQVIDLTKAPDEAYQRLERGLLAAGLDPADAFDWDGKRPPYPGLLAFQEEDAAVFFGRGDEIDEGLDRLNQMRRLGGIGWVIVLGASGTGKSSLVRAGIVPKLRRDAESWLVIDPFRPRDNPTRELAGALSRTYAPLGRAIPWQELRERLQPDAAALASDRIASNPLVEMAHDLRLQSAHAEARILLVVDQFEELLGQPDDHPASRFLTLLREAVEKPGSPLLVLATLRSDFFGSFQKNPALLDLRFENLSLGPMSRDDIVKVIQGPADRAGFDLEPGLVEILVDDAAGGDALPLLAFALRELYERCGKKGRLEIKIYQEELGGLNGAVARAADDLLRMERLEPAEEDRLRHVFLRMVRVTEEGRYARQPARWDDLPASVHPLLERFVQARLLVSGGDDKARTVEVAHEALFESWDRLRSWLDQRREGLRLRREIHRDALSWDNEGRAEEILWRGGRLARARELITSDVLPLEDLDHAFVEAAEQAERARMEAAVRQALAAEERAREAAIERERALSAQNFAEHQRVKARAGEAVEDNDRTRALAAIAPKYLEQSRLNMARARELEAELAAWRQDHRLRPERPESLFSLEILKAGVGGCLILHYGPPSAPRFMLFDGGDNRIYRESLRPRLEALRCQWAGDRALPIDLVVSSQTDNTHFRGLLDLMKELEELPAQERPFEIGALWSNAFLPGTGRAAEVIARSRWKARLVAGAKAVGIPVNEPFSRLITLPEAGAARVHWEHGFSTTVLGPPVEWLRRFADFWLREIAKSVDCTGEAPETVEAVAAALRDVEILETFASRRIELLPSPIEIVDIPIPQAREQSVSNLASIVLMLELEGRRMLLTADSRSDVLLQALAQAGYVDETGSLEVDILVLPHSGSDSNVSVEFFQRVRARHYVIQTNGRFYRNPKLRTFEMLFEARRDDGQPFTIYMNYPAEELRKSGYPIDPLYALFEEERRRGTYFGIVTPAEGQASLAIDLSSRASYLDPGVCDPYPSTRRST